MNLQQGSSVNRTMFKNEDLKIKDIKIGAPFIRIHNSQVIHNETVKENDRSVTM